MPMCGTKSVPERVGLLVRHISSPESSMSAGLMPVQHEMAAASMGGACLSEQLSLTVPKHAQSGQQQLSGYDADAVVVQSSTRRQVKRSTTWPKQRMMGVILEDGLQFNNDAALADDLNDDELEQGICAAAAACDEYAAAALAVGTDQALSATTPSPVAASASAWSVPAHSSSSSGGAVPARQRGVIKRQSSAITGRELMRSAGVTFADQAAGKATLSGRRRSLGTASFDMHADVPTEALPAVVPSVVFGAAAGGVAAAPVGQSALNPHHRLPKRRASAPHLGSLTAAIPSAVPARVPTVLASAHAPSCECTECVCAKTAQLVQQLKQQQQLQCDQAAAMRTGNAPHQLSAVSPQGSLNPGQPDGHLAGVYLQGAAAFQGGANHQGSAGHLPGFYQQQGAVAVQGGLLYQRSLSPGQCSAGQPPGAYQQPQGSGLHGLGLQQQGTVRAQGGLWHLSSLPSPASGTHTAHWSGQQTASHNPLEPLPSFADGTIPQMPQQQQQQQQQQSLMHWGGDGIGAAAAAAVNGAHPAGNYAGGSFAVSRGMAFDPVVATTFGVGLLADQSLQHGLHSQTSMLPRRSFEGHANQNLHSNISPLATGAMMPPTSMATAAAASPAMSNVSGSVTVGPSPSSSTAVAAQHHVAQSIGMMSLSSQAGQQQQQHLIGQQQQDMLTARQQLVQALQQRRRQQLAALQQQQNAASLQQQQQKYQQQQPQQLGRQHRGVTATVLAAARSNPEQVLGMLLQKAKHVNLTPSQLEKLHRVVQLKQRLVASKVMLARMSNTSGQAAAGQGAVGSCAVQQQLQQQQQGVCPPNCQQPCCVNVDNELQQMMAMAQAEVARQPQQHQQQQAVMGPCAMQPQQQQQGAAGWSCAGAGFTTGAVAAMWQQSAAAAAADPGAGVAAMPLFNGSTGSSNYQLQQQLSAGASLLSQGSNNYSSLLQQQQQQQQEMVAAPGGFGSFTALLQDPTPSNAAAAAAADLQPATASAAAGPGGIDSLQQLTDLDLSDLGDDLNQTLDLNELDVSSFGLDDDLIGLVDEMVGADATYLSVQADFTKEQQRQEKLKLYQQQVDKYKQLQLQQQQGVQQAKGADAISNVAAGQAGCSAAATVVPVAACPSLSTGPVPSGPVPTEAGADDWLNQFSLGLVDLEQDVFKLA